MNEKWGRKIDGGWLDEEQHIYRCDRGIIRPSTTQVFDLLGMVDLGNASKEVLDFKSQYGISLHRGVQLLAAEDLDWDSVDDRLIAPLTGIEQFLKDVEFVIEAAEEARVITYAGMTYGMTLDLRGSMTYQGKRRKAIADVKTGIKFSPTWTWQLGGYILPYPVYSLGVIFQIRPDGKVIPHYVADIEKAKREFQILLAAAILKINAQLDKSWKNGAYGNTNT